MIESPKQKVVTSLLSIFRSNAAQFRANLAKVREEQEQARRRWEYLRAAPLPVDDVLAQLSTILDLRSEAFQESLERRLSRFVTDSPKLNPATARNWTMLLDGAAVTNGQYMEHVLSAFLKTEILAKLRPIVERMVGDKAGPPRAARDLELAKLDTELRELEQREKEMLAELDAIKQEVSG